MMDLGLCNEKEISRSGRLEKTSERERERERERMKNGFRG